MQKSPPLPAGPEFIFPISSGSHSPARQHADEMGAVICRGMHIRQKALCAKSSHPLRLWMRNPCPALLRCQWHGRHKAQHPSPPPALCPCHPAPQTRQPWHSVRPGWGTSDALPSSGSGSCTAVMISPAFKAVSNMPVKNLSAAILRLLVINRGTKAQAGRRIVRCRIIVGDGAANGAPVAHMNAANLAGHFRTVPEWPS